MAPPPRQQDDPTLLASDPEDSDFELGDDDDAHSGGSDSSDSEREDGNGRQRKRQKLADTADEKPVLTKEAADDLWAQFNAQDPPANNSAEVLTSSAVSTKKPKMIKITVDYEFVGETVTQEKEVPEDSPEAKQWLARQVLLKGNSAKGKGKAAESSGAQNGSADTSISSNGTATSMATTKDSGAATAADTSASISTSAAPAPRPHPAPMSTSSSSSTALPAKKPAPGPRKKAAGGGLAGLAASLGAGKPAKLNTLEKSKLDWNKFVSKDPSLSDTLTHARKDGYLSKQDFLGRTDEAKERAWEEGKKGKRR